MPQTGIIIRCDNTGGVLMKMARAKYLSVEFNNAARTVTWKHPSKPLLVLDAATSSVLEQI